MMSSPETQTPTPARPDAPKVQTLLACVLAAEERLLHFYENGDIHLSNFFNFDVSVMTLQRLAAVHKTVEQMLYNRRPQNEVHLQQAANTVNTLLAAFPANTTATPTTPDHSSHDSHDSQNSPTSPAEPVDSSDSSDPSTLAAELSSINQTLDTLATPAAPSAGGLPGLTPMAQMRTQPDSPSTSGKQTSISEINAVAPVSFTLAATPAVAAVPFCPKSLEKNLKAANDYLDDRATEMAATSPARDADTRDADDDDLDDTDPFADAVDGRIYSEDGSLLDYDPDRDPHHGEPEEEDPLAHLPKYRMTIEELDAHWLECHQKWLNDPVAQKKEREYQAHVAAREAIWREQDRAKAKAKAKANPPPPNDSS